MGFICLKLFLDGMRSILRVGSLPTLFLPKQTTKDMSKKRPAPRQRDNTPTVYFNDFSKLLKLSAKPNLLPKGWSSKQYIDNVVYIKESDTFYQPEFEVRVDKNFDLSIIYFAWQTPKSSSINLNVKEHTQLQLLRSIEALSISICKGIGCLQSLTSYHIVHSRPTSLHREMGGPPGEHKIACR